MSRKVLDLESMHDNTGFLIPHDDFRRDINVVFDRILSELKTRYEGNSLISSEVYFLMRPALRNRYLNDLTKRAADFWLKYTNDVHMVELCNEVEIFKFQTKELIDLKTTTPMDMLEKMIESNLRNI